MNTEEIQELTVLVNQMATSVNARSKLALERLKSVPGGLECFRRELAKLNLDSATFDRLLSGDLEPEDHAALVLALAGLKSATN